jgi:hypothetical protein
MTKAYKYRGGIGLFDEKQESIFKRDVNTLANNQIYIPTKEKLNDPTEGLFYDIIIKAILGLVKDYFSEVRKQYDMLIQKIENLGIYSLSKNNDNELLWAYYASGHTGFAIEYDIDKLKESLNYNMYYREMFDFNVRYKKSIPQSKISDLQSRSVKYILKMYLGTKSKRWKHEEEYRLIFENKGLFDIDYRAVTGIYFGYRMKESEMDYIMSRLKGRSLQYYKMDLIDNTYQFRPHKIHDKFPNAPKYYANELDYDIEALLLSEKIIGEKAYSYKNKLIEALEIVKHEPLINKIYSANISIESGKPIFRIFAYTNSELAPTKKFQFELDKDGCVTRIK